MTEVTAGRSGPHVWRVAALVAAVADLLQTRFFACAVRGEVSGFSRASSGHCYFNLKDPDGGATLRCAMFRRAAQLAAFEPREGDSVELRGRLALYEPRGELQFVVESIQKSGAGALYERFLQLRARLEAEGLFDPAAKRPLPRHPVTLGIVTSLSGAALHDVATALARRSPHIRAVVYPSLVQGPDAPAALCQAIGLAGKRREVDLLIVCRGGGSLEDLWAFNDERVARAIRAAPIPVVSGIGHETDVTLADLAADVRAPTPTAAAELAAPVTSVALDELARLAARRARQLGGWTEREAQRVDRAAMRLARPGDSLTLRAHALDLMGHRLAGGGRRCLEERVRRATALEATLRQAIGRVRDGLTIRLDRAALRLQALDPRRVLERGYVMLTDDAGLPLSSTQALVLGQAVTATMRDGSAGLIVASVAASRPADRHSDGHDP